MSDFREVQPKDFMISPFHAIGSDWMLITAEKEGQVNTMTASWGGLGVIWGRNAAYVFVRDSRYTKEFMDAADTFSLTFFDREKYADMLAYMGKVSGRDEDKIAKVGLTPVFDAEYNTTYFAEAKLTLICRKLYRGRLTEDGFTDPAFVEEYYPHRDFHYVYYGEIVKTLVAD